MPRLSLFVKVVAVTSVALSIAVLLSSDVRTVDRLNLAMKRSIMRLVRDMSRIKARRRANEDFALVPLLFGTDNDGEAILRELDDHVARESTIVQPNELNDAKGRTDDDPLWIAVLGHVFDVRAGTKFYGKGGPYESLSGRDATLALATGDLSVARDMEEDDANANATFRDDEDVNEEIMAEARRWLDYFASHAKYKHVGRLPRAGDLSVNLDAIVDKEIEAEQELWEEDDDEEDDWDEDDEVSRPPEWHPKVSSDDQSTCPGGGNSKIKR